MALNEITMLKSLAAGLSNATTSLYGLSADIVLSIDNGKDWIVFPVVPSELPPVQQVQNHENFQGVLGDLAIIGTLGLRSITFDLLVPEYAMKYPFCRPEGDTAPRIKSFIDDHRKENKPFRLNVVYENGEVYANFPVLINNYTFYADSTGDTHITLEFVEYRFADELAKNGGIK